jgi:hypothetical protein
MQELNSENRLAVGSRVGNPTIQPPFGLELAFAGTRFWPGRPFFGFFAYFLHRPVDLE